MSSQSVIWNLLAKVNAILIAEGISGASSKNKATTALVPDEYGYRTNSWTAKKKYIPIAQSELDSDPALVQNAYK